MTKDSAGTASNPLVVELSISSPRVCQQSVQRLDAHNKIGQHSLLRLRDTRAFNLVELYRYLRSDGINNLVELYRYLRSDGINNLVELYRYLRSDGINQTGLIRRD